MSKEMREQLDITKNLLKEEKNDLNKKYKNIIFSNEFNIQNKNITDYLRKEYIRRIDDFITFYNKYQTKGIRVIDGIDLYEESKTIFDKIINGEEYIDEVFRDPDNPLRNIVMLLHIDEPRLK